MKNACIVGFGSIGPAHASVVEQLEEVRLYAVCDTDPAALQRCRKHYADVLCFDDFEAMLKDDKIDVVHICTPHYLHLPMIEQALASGKSVVAEKPIVMNNAELNRLLSLDGVEDVCTVLQNRHNPCAEKLKEVIDRGDLGEIRAVKGLMTWYRNADYYNDDWHGRWDTEGGSVLINQALHTMDLLVYLTGGVESLQAHMCNFSLKDVIETEDTMLSRLQFKSGATGLFCATNAYGVNSPIEIEVVGSKATARYAYKKLMVDGEILAEDNVPLPGRDYWGGGHAALLTNYYKYNKFFSPVDIAHSMRVLFGMYDSAKCGGGEVVIKEEAQ